MSRADSQRNQCTPEAGIQFQQVAEGISEQFPYADEPAGRTLSAIAAVLSVERCSAIQADFNRVQVASSDIGVAQHAADRLEPAFKAIDGRLPHRLCRSRKILLEVRVAYEIIMCDAAGSTLSVVFLLKNLRARYPGDLQHLLDMMRQPRIKLIDDLAININRNFVYWPEGVFHRSDCRYFFFAVFFFEATFLRLLFFAAARFFAAVFLVFGLDC